MKLLITGGCGFIGTNLAVHALSSGMDLMLYDDLSRHGSHLNLKWLEGRGTFRFVEADIRDEAEVTRTVDSFRPDVIFHLAGQVAMTSSLTDPRRDMEINIQGTFNVLEAVRRFCPRAVVVYSSTNKVYGDLEQFRYEEWQTRYVCPDMPGGFDEETPLCFHTPYGCSKGAADQYVLDYARMYGLKTVVFRHSSMYGGRQFATVDQGWIGWFCRQALENRRRGEGQPVEISGTGLQVRDVLHTEDIVRLYFSVLSAPETVFGEAFNIGGGPSNSLSLIELFAFLSEWTGAEMHYEKRPVRASDQKVFIADTGKAARWFGWSPRVDFRRGIYRMLDWIEHGT